MDKQTTRFAPSPTGHLHVGGARTALFSYLIARKTGGTFVLRIEDTDRARHLEEAVGMIAEDLRWLGIEWDEGVEAGGPNGPYRQSERLDIYRARIEQLLAEGKAYYAFDTAEELDAQRKAAEAAKQSFRYVRPDPMPTAADADTARAAGKPVVVRFLCPERDVTIEDDAYGPVTMPANEMDDFIIQKADGFPTYHLANVIDDAMMGVTCVLRGQEFLGQTWRQVLLREALGLSEPRYCHLPLIMDMQGRKLSKRDGAVEVDAFRKAGYLPEALVNFLALLGWNPGGQRERMTLDEMVELFDVSRIGKSNAKFDRDKLLAFNTDAMADASPERKLACFKDFLARNDTHLPVGDEALLARLLEINDTARTFQDIVDKCDILFAPDEKVVYDPKAVKKALRKGDNAGFAALADARPELAEVEWSAEALEAWMSEFCQRREIGMGKIAQPLRVAVTGTPVSPQIVDTLLLAGKDRTLARIDRCLQLRDSSA
jgi:glutamyl-tRNA synthetase